MGFLPCKTRHQLSKAKESLEVLNIEGSLVPIIDASFVSPIRRFQNLGHLSVEVYCHGEDDGGRCIFKLDNDNVTELAMALTQLESLLLGRACFENTCTTTVSCLLPISVHCVKLKKLEIHFSTTNIVEDFKNIPRFQQSRSLPRYPLARLGVYRTPLSLNEPGFETVAKGMIDIFPSLERCEGLERIWDRLTERIELQEM